MKLLCALLAAALATAAGAEEAKPAGPKLATGLLMQQGGKLVFAPCRDRSYAIVDDISPGAAVTAALKDIGLEAGKKLYVELFGAVEGVALKTSGLNFARAEGRCQPPGTKEEAWRAAGEGWTLAAGGDQLVVKRSGKPEAAVPFGPMQQKGNAFSHEAAGKTPVVLRFAPGTCRDKAGEAVFGWSATVTVNGETLKGCAWQR